MFDGSISDGNHQLIRSRPIGLNYNGAVFTFGRIQQGAKLLKRCFLVAKVNRAGRAAGDADYLRVLLRPEHEPGKRDRDGNAGLEHEVRAQEQKKNQKKHDIDQREHNQPPEIIFFRPVKLHSVTPVIDPPIVDF